MNIIYFSRFCNNPSGNGGDKRATQLFHFLAAIGCDFESIHSPMFTLPQKMKNLLFSPSGYFQKIRSERYKQRLTYGKYTKWSDQIREHLLYMHFLSFVFIESLQKSPRLLCIDDPVFLAPVVHFAKSRKIPVVAFCHNLETLSREQVDYEFQKEMFSYELELISMCDLVVTISVEETFVLKNFGMNPLFFPYFPLEQTAQRLGKVRRARQHSVKLDYLLLGTAHNLPTMEGMKRVISKMAGSTILEHDRLLVAGYGTQLLMDLVDDTRIELRGEVTDAELDDILTGVKGCIVYQENGSGALTKVPELLTAGVPVIINSHAARSHHHLPGIFEFSDLAKLNDQIALAAQCEAFPAVLSTPDPSSLLWNIEMLLG